MRKDLELQRLKLNREVELKEILKKQMIELKQREAESEILNREENELMQEQYEIMKLNEQRVAINLANARQEYGKGKLLNFLILNFTQKHMQVKKYLILSLTPPTQGKTKTEN